MMRIIIIIIVIMRMVGPVPWGIWKSSSSSSSSCGQFRVAFEKYKFGKQSRWQYRLPIIVPSSVQPLHSHLPAKKVMTTMMMMMMIDKVDGGVALAMVMLMMIVLVTSTYFYDKRWWWFPPGFVKISLKDFYRLPDFIFAFCNLCIVRFRFPPSSTPAVKYRRYQIQIQKQIVQFRSPRTFSSPSGSLSNKKR